MSANYPIYGLHVVVFIRMAYIIIAFIGAAYTVMTYIVMNSIATAFIVVTYTIMACKGVCKHKEYVQE